MKYALQDYSLKKLPFKGKSDASGIPQFDPSSMGWEGTWCYHPTVVIQYALACYERRENGYEQDFLNCSKWILNNIESYNSGELYSWSIPFPIRTPKIPAPWYSALTQSQGISVLLRYWQITGDIEVKEALEKLVIPLITPVRNGGMLYHDNEDNTFLEEAAEIHILNGCLTALYGLYEYNCLFPNENVALAVSQVKKTVECWLPKYDSGYWSRYSLGLRFNLADMHYHLLHINQLNELGFRLDSEIFLNYARKWSAYTTDGGNLIRSMISRFFVLNFSRMLTILKLNKFKYR